MIMLIQSYPRSGISSFLGTIRPIYHTLGDLFKNRKKLLHPYWEYGIILCVGGNKRVTSITNICQ